MQDPIYARLSAPRPSLRAAGALVLLATAGLWIASLLALALPMPVWAVNLIYYIPFVLMPVGLYAARRGTGESLRLNPLSFGGLTAAVLLALMSVYAASALVYGWEALLVRFHLTPGPGIAAPESRAALSWAILISGALPGVCEELLFRGTVLPAWESRGTRLAIVMSAAMFALIHGDIYGWPAYLLVGAVAATLTVCLDSLYASMVYHTTYNAACLLAAFAVAGLEGGDAVPISAGELLGIALQTAFVLAMMGMLLYSLYRRGKAEGALLVPRIHRPLSFADKLWLGLACAAMLVTTILEL